MQINIFGASQNHNLQVFNSIIISNEKAVDILDRLVAGLLNIDVVRMHFISEKNTTTKQLSTLGH